MSKPNLLRAAIENRAWTRAAHVMVIGAVQARAKESNGKKRRSKV